MKQAVRRRPQAEAPAAIACMHDHPRQIEPIALTADPLLADAECGDEPGVASRLARSLIDLPVGVSEEARTRQAQRGKIVGRAFGFIPPLTAGLSSMASRPFVSRCGTTLPL